MINPIFACSQKGLQYCLMKLERYTNRWKLNINKKKSKILLIGPAAQRCTYVTTNWVFDSNILEQVNEYCYLGIIINPSGTFKKALKALHNKALRAYHCLFKKFSNFDNVPISLLLKLFSSMVIPILLYCSEIWGPYMLGKITTFEMFKNKMFKFTNELEKFHVKFCKRIPGVHSKSTNVAVYAELGRLPLIVLISIQIVKYWLNIMVSLLIKL